MSQIRVGIFSLERIFKDCTWLEVMLDDNFYVEIYHLRKNLHIWVNNSCDLWLLKKYRVSFKLTNDLQVYIYLLRLYRNNLFFIY